MFVSSFPYKTPWASRRVSWDELKTRLAEANFKEAPENTVIFLWKWSETTIATTGFPKGENLATCFLWVFFEKFLWEEGFFCRRLMHLGWVELGEKKWVRLFLYLSYESQQVILVAVSPEFFGIASCKVMGDTVDGSEIPNNHLGCFWNPENHG